MSKMDGMYIKLISDMQTVLFLSSPVQMIKSAWSDDNSKIAGVGVDKIIRIWSTTNGVLLGTLESSLWVDRIEDIVWSGNRLYSLGLEGPFIIWDTTTYQIIQNFNTFAGQDLELSPDGNKLAIAGFAGIGIIEVANLDNGILDEGIFLNQNAQLWTFSWKPDGQKIASGSVDGIVRIWDITTATLETTLDLNNETNGNPNIINVQWGIGYIAIGISTSLDTYVFEDVTYTLLDTIETDNPIYSWDSEGSHYVVYNRFSEQTGVEKYCTGIIPSEDLISLSQEINLGNTDVLGNVICLSPNATYTLTAPLPTITGDITVIGNGAQIVMTGAGRVFDVASTGGLTLKNITVSGGNAVQGGAIYNAGDLTLENVVLDNNSATDGGAIYNVGNLEMDGGAIQNNTATNFGGGIYNLGEMDVDGVNIRDNDAPEGSGVYQGE